MANDPVNEIRERLEIVDLIHSYVPSLRKAGNSHKGLCPFHNEKTPSFIVFPNTQSYHCFGCGKSGDIFNFYMEMEKVEFRDALKELGQRAGVEVTTSAPRPPEEDEKRKRLIEINELAAMWFNHILINATQGAAGRALIEDRKVSPESVQTWKLGFAPDSWDALLNFMASRNYQAAEVAEAGLASERDGGGFYDRFRNRLMFPIRDRDGNTVGFGGRALGDAQPKYLNTAQTRIFDKSHLLYGLDLAKDAIRDTDQVVIVEGYMDAIATHEFGFKNVVASMGTALTDAQVDLIKRGNPQIVLALDADAAGQMATMRGLQTMTDSLSSEEMVPMLSADRVLGFERKLKADIRIVQLEGGKDPDDIVRSEPERWPRVVSQAVPFMDFVIDVSTRDIDVNDPAAKSEAVKQVLPLLRQLPDAIRENHYARMLARKLDLPESAIAEARRDLRMSSRRTAGGRQEPKSEKPVRRSTEDYLIGLLIHHHQLNYSVLEQLEPEDFQDPRNREILQVLKSPETDGLQGMQIVVGLPDSIADHAEAVLESLGPRPKVLGGQVLIETQQAASRVKRERHQHLVNQLNAEINAARKEGDEATVNELLDQYQRLMEGTRYFAPVMSPYFHDIRTPKKSG